MLAGEFVLGFWARAENFEQLFSARIGTNSLLSYTVDPDRRHPTPLLRIQMSSGSEETVFSTLIDAEIGPLPSLVGFWNLLAFKLRLESDAGVYGTFITLEQNGREIGQKFLANDFYSEPEGTEHCLGSNFFESNLAFTGFVGSFFYSPYVKDDYFMTDNFSCATCTICPVT
jgi:hypothetical protein